MNAFSACFYLVLVCLLMLSCNDDDIQENIPEVRVNRSINLNNPSNSDLNARGGHILLEEGYRGIILYHDMEGRYRAFERACTYHPHTECARVSVRRSSIEFGCGTYIGEGEDEEWDACCDSHFQSDGMVVQGPARYPLKQYQVFRDGSILTISN